MHITSELVIVIYRTQMTRKRLSILQPVATSPPPPRNKLLLTSPIVGEDEAIEEEEIEIEVAEKGDLAMLMNDEQNNRARRYYDYDRWG